MNVTIKILGCDASTVVNEFDVDGDELELLRRLQEAVNGNALYGCYPTLHITVEGS
jgi:hypothetical protein